MGEDIPFIWVVNTLECDIFLVLEETVELWSQAVESQLSEDELHVSSDQGAASCIYH